jgi:hypothetical protein
MQSPVALQTPSHMTPCACHCAARREAGHGNTCVLLRMGLLKLCHGKADIVDLVFRHYHAGLCAWELQQVYTY